MCFLFVCFGEGGGGGGGGGGRKLPNVRTYILTQNKEYYEFSC
jgi:hypothetical protein